MKLLILRGLYKKVRHGSGLLYASGDQSPLEVYTLYRSIACVTFYNSRDPWWMYIRFNDTPPGFQGII